MRKTLLVGTIAVALLPSPSHAAACGLGDARGDATVWDDAVLDGAHDRPVTGPAVDLVSAWVEVGTRVTTFRVRVADLATVAVDAPSGVAYAWTAETAANVVHVVAWSAPTSSGVEVYAGRTLGDATWVARTTAPVLDVASDTVTFTVATQTLGLRPGTRVASTVTSHREVAVEAPDGARMQGAAADSATRRPWSWGRC